MKFGAFGDTFSLKIAVLCWSLTQAVGDQWWWEGPGQFPVIKWPRPSFALLYFPLLCSNFPPPALYNIVSSLHFIALNGELHRRCRVPAITISVYCPHCPVYCLLPPLVNCCPWMGRVPSTSPLLLLRSADIYGTAVNLPGIPHQPITFKSVLRKCPQRFFRQFIAMRTVLWQL